MQESRPIVVGRDVMAHEFLDAVLVAGNGRPRDHDRSLVVTDRLGLRERTAVRAILCASTHVQRRWLQAERRNELGRIRKFPEIKSSQFFVRAAAERQAVNFPIQSLAADVIKLAMIEIHKQLTTYNLQLTTDCRMLLQVHDELVFEVREDKVEHYTKILIPLMENAIKLPVPIKVEAKVGENWGEMFVI
jgi:hypothetical protein